MNKMKRVFSLVLVLSMILGSFGAALPVVHAAEGTTAATEELRKVPKDVMGTEYEKAVSRLVAFGVLEGYEDGTYKPEKDVTRAEFAKILVESLGISRAASAAKGQSQFKDVTASHWASGYINVASGNSLIKGFPDGTYKPEDKVSHAEALTMLVRALGYQDSFLKGMWPGSHIAKAAEVGITSGVKFNDASGFANRGNVAQMVNNTLDSKVIKVDKYTEGKVDYYETDIPLLKDKLEISKYEDTRIIADKIVNDGLSKNELEIRFLKDSPGFDKKDRYDRGEIVKEVYRAGKEEKLDFAKNVNPREAIGEEVTVYMNDKKEIIYVERENDDKVHFDFVEKIKGNKLKLVNFDREYDFEKSTRDNEADVAIVHSFNHKDSRFNRADTVSELEDLDLEKFAGKIGKFVVRNNKIVYAEILDPQEVNNWLVVMKNDDGLIEGVSGQTENFKMDLRKDKDYDDIMVFNTKGEKMSLKDIKKGNLLYVQQQDYDGDDVAVVTVVEDNVVEGKAGRVKTDKIEIEGKEIKVVKYEKKDNKDPEYLASYTVDDLDEVKKWEKTIEWEDDMEDAHKQDVVAYKDAAGRIAFLNVGGGHSGYKFGIVTRTYADGDKIRIYTSIDGKEGKDIVFKADKERDISTTEARMLDENGMETNDPIKDQSLLGSAVKFRLDSNGEIAKDKFFVMPKDSVLSMRDDFGKDLVKAKLASDDKVKKTFAVNSDSTIVIDAESAPIHPNYGKDNDNLDGKNASYKDRTDWKVDVDNFNIATWKDIKDDKEDKNVRFFVFPKNNKSEEVDAFVFVGKDGASTGTDEEAIYITDRWRAGSDVKVTYVKYPENKEETRIIDEDKDSLVENLIKKEKAYVAKEKSSGKISIVKESKDFERFEDKIITKVSGNYIYLKGEKDRLLISGSLIYDEDASKTTSFLKRGMHVDVIYDGVRARVIGYTGKDSKVVDGDIEDDSEKIEGKKLESVSKVRGDVWVVIDGKQYLFGGTYDEANALKGKQVTFETTKIDKDTVVTKIEEVVEKPVVNKTNLEAAVKKAKAVKEAEYTAESFKTVTAALALKEETQEEVDAKVAAIDKAVKELDKVKEPAVPAAVDKAALTKAIADVKYVKVSTDGKDVETTEKWTTAEVKTALETAVTAAETVKNKADATKEKVEEAVTTLEEAVTVYNNAKKAGTL